MSSVGPGAFVTISGEVLADAVVGHPARHVHAGSLRDRLGELDRVVRASPTRSASARSAPTLPSTTSNRGDEPRCRGNVVPAEVPTCIQAGDERVVRRVLVVLDPLEQRVGAVSDADQRDADRVLAARVAAVR